MHFNVSFMTNARPAIAMDLATAALDRALVTHPTGNAGHRPLAHRWLFPEPSDVNRDLLVVLPIPDDGFWEDIGLNHEQKVSWKQYQPFHFISLRSRPLFQSHTINVQYHTSYPVRREQERQVASLAGLAVI